MEKAIHYFNENYYRDIKIEEYARQQHMSTCWFIRSFKQYMNVPPLKYLTSVRIRRARELLETTDYTVSEIGALVGYDNPLYFSRIFKKQTGVSPADTEMPREMCHDAAHPRGIFSLSSP
ncbi:MAG: helix-turn-helix domain-containing protein [Blautia marasmi]